MSDIFQNATKYRNRLKAEIAKVDEFLRMAEEFSKETDPDARLAINKTAANTMSPDKPSIELARRPHKEAAAS